MKSVYSSFLEIGGLNWYWVIKLAVKPPKIWLRMKGRAADTSILLKDR
jgi:hypothetical protein